MFLRRKSAVVGLAACLVLTGSVWRLLQTLAEDLPKTRVRDEVKADSGAANADFLAKPLSYAQFEKLLKVIRPLPGEYAWRDEIPWQTRLQTAREKAVAADKPILILASANAFALGRT
jgi:hypothetical protein